MSKLNGRKISYVALHTPLFVPSMGSGQKPLGNLPDKLLSGPVTATKGTGYDMTKQEDCIIVIGPNGQELLIPMTQVQIAVLMPESPALAVVKSK